MMSTPCVAIFWVINASNDEKSCLQFSIPTESGLGGERGVSQDVRYVHRLPKVLLDQNFNSS